MMGTSEIEVLQARLSAVERKFRIMSVAWLVGLVVAVVLGIGAQRVASQTQTLSARQLNIVDDAGRTRISLGLTTSGTPAIWEYDTAGKTRVYLGFGAQRPTPVFILADENGQDRINLGFSVTGVSTPQLALSDPRGIQRLYFGWSTTEKPVLYVHDESDRDLWHAP